MQQVHRRDFLGALEGDGPISSSMADVLVPEGMGARKLLEGVMEAHPYNADLLKLAEETLQYLPATDHI